MTLKYVWIKFLLCRHKKRKFYVNVCRGCKITSFRRDVCDWKSAKMGGEIKKVGKSLATYFLQCVKVCCFVAIVKNSTLNLNLEDDKNFKERKNFVKTKRGQFWNNGVELKFGGCDYTTVLQVHWT